jgi:hypothetical protein
VTITTEVMSSNPAHGEVYFTQHDVIHFVSDLRQVGGFLQVLWFPPPIKLTATYDITEILLKMALDTIALNLYISFHDCFDFYPTLALYNYIQDMFTLLTV